MSFLKLPVNDRKEFVRLIIAGEILTRRGEPGPLQRLWIPIGPKKQPTTKISESERRSKE